MSSQAALSLLSRYEALFELFENVNTSAEIEAAGQVLAGRLKYVADVFSWRYLRVEPDGPEPGSHAEPIRRSSRLWIVIGIGSRADSLPAPRINHSAPRQRQAQGPLWITSV